MNKFGELVRKQKSEHSELAMQNDGDCSQLHSVNNDAQNKEVKVCVPLNCDDIIKFFKCKCYGYNAFEDAEAEAHDSECNNAKFAEIILKIVKGDQKILIKNTETVVNTQNLVSYAKNTLNNKQYTENVDIELEKIKKLLLLGEYERARGLLATAQQKYSTEISLNFIRKCNYDYVIADANHLLNDYNTALEGFEILKASQEFLQAGMYEKAFSMAAHCNKHKGEFSTAISQYEDFIYESKNAKVNEEITNNLISLYILQILDRPSDETKAKCVDSLDKIFKNKINADKNEAYFVRYHPIYLLLKNVKLSENNYSTQAMTSFKNKYLSELDIQYFNNNALFKLWQLIEEDYKEIQACKESNKPVEKKLRLIYNNVFALAECLRIDKKYEDALPLYMYVYDGSLKHNDYNMYSIVCVALKYLEKFKNVHSAHAIDITVIKKSCAENSMNFNFNLCSQFLSLVQKSYSNNKIDITEMEKSLEYYDSTPMIIL